MNLSSSPIGGLISVIMAAATPSWAQQPDRIIYPAGHFAQYAPGTALDMVRRTPGFVLVEGDAEIRGFGGAAGNVLIDGARPTSKAGLADALSRIPASAVERIEVMRNASTGEAQGQSLVVNVVRLTSAASGTWSVELEHNGNDVIYPRLEASYSREIGGWQTSVKANAYWEEFPFRTLRINRDATGDLVSSTVTDLPSTLTEAYLSGDARRPVGGGMLNLTGRFGRYNYFFDQPGETYLGRLPAGEAEQRQLNQLDVERWVFEAGVDYTRGMRDWNWKSVGLVNYRDGGQTQRERRETAAGALVSRTMIQSTARPLEIVGRTTFTGTGNRVFKPEIGGEIAYNRFDRTFALSVDDGSGLTAIDIPAANVLVEEIRGEAFANLTWTLSPRWTLEAGLATEASEISVSGDAAQSQTFSFIKPSLALTWRPNERFQVRAGARQSIGQLDFNDFAATAQLDDDTTAAGNPDLGPDQTTRYYVAFDCRGPGDFAANLEAFHEDRKDVLEQVLLTSGAPGLANAGAATDRGLKGSITLPLNRLLPGARLTADGEVRDTAFDDPIIGRVRPLSDISTPVLRAEFRHDPPDLPFSWGVTWQGSREAETYLVNEVARSTIYDSFGGFVETTAIGRFKTRLAARNADTQRSERSRRFFAPDRSGHLVGTEARFTRSPTFVTLTLSGGF